MNRNKICSFLISISTGKMTHTTRFSGRLVMTLTKGSYEVIKGKFISTPHPRQTDPRITKNPQIPKLPLVSIDSDLTLRHWSFARWTKRFKSLRLTEILELSKLAKNPPTSVYRGWGCISKILRKKLLKVFQS